MGYRVLCDENVHPETVDHLEADGHEAVHVPGALSTGVDDHSVAAYAREEGYLLLTNDTDFLDAETYPELTVLYFPDNRTGAYELASMVDRLAELVPEPERLPRTVFLTDEG